MRLILICASVLIILCGGATLYILDASVAYFLLGVMIAAVVVIVAFLAGMAADEALEGEEFLVERIYNAVSKLFSKGN